MNNICELIIVMFNYLIVSVLYFNMFLYGMLMQNMTHFIFIGARISHLTLVSTMTFKALFAHNLPYGRESERSSAAPMYKRVREV